MRRVNLSRSGCIGLTLVLVFSTGMWVYVNRVLPGWKSARREASRDQLGADLGDLYPRWLGARELLLHHRDPYSQEVTEAIETAYYGRALEPGEHKDQQRFAYPLYVALLMAPFVKWPFPIVQVIFRYLLAGLTIASIPLWLRAIGWPASALTLIAAGALTVTSIPLAQGLHLQQLALMVAALLAAAAAAVVGNHFLVAGVLLGLATIKPQMALLPEAWFMIWVLGDWRRRQNVFWGFLATIGILVGASSYVSPGWMTRFLEGLLAYPQYTGTVSLVSVFIPRREIELPLAGFMLAGVAALCWRKRREPAQSPFFTFALALALTIALLVIPTAMPPYNQLFLLPAVFLIVRGWQDLRLKTKLRRLICIALGIIVVSPWPLALALVIRKFVFHVESLGLVPAPAYASMVLPFAVLGLLLLRWYRPSPLVVQNTKVCAEGRALVQ